MSMPVKVWNIKKLQAEIEGRKMLTPNDIRHIRSLLGEVEDRKQFWHWLKCELCGGYSIFDDHLHMFDYQKRGVCACGHRLFKVADSGNFSKGTIYVWDECDTEDDDSSEIEIFSSQDDGALVIV